jgi:Ran GTPase-activating protein (RanGAP) involved in mRNA processing and transport
VTNCGLGPKGGEMIAEAMIGSNKRVFKPFLRFSVSKNLWRRLKFSKTEVKKASSTFLTLLLNAKLLLSTSMSKITKR